MLTDGATPTQPAVDSDGRGACTCVTQNVGLRARASVSLVCSGAGLAPGGYARVMDTSARSISLPTNQPYMILHFQMQNTPIIDAVMK